jgi:TonB family protein
MRIIIIIFGIFLTFFSNAQKINSELLVNSWKLLFVGEQMIPSDEAIIFKFTKNKLFIESDKNSNVLDYKVDKNNIIITNESKKIIWSIEELDNSKLIFLDEQSIKFSFVILNTNKDFLVQLPQPPPPPPPQLDEINAKSPGYDNVSSDVEPEIYTIIEDQPSFPGCEDILDKTERQRCSDKKMVTFLAENAGYPEAAREAGFEGTVFIRFVVETDGSISSIEALKDQTPGGGLKDASLNAVRAMNNMEKKWNPGMQKGKPVRVRVVVPVKFKLDFEDAQYSIETDFRPNGNITKQLEGVWKIISINNDIIPQNNNLLIEFKTGAKVIFTYNEKVDKDGSWKISKDSKKIIISKPYESESEVWGIKILDKDRLCIIDSKMGSFELIKQ